MMIEERMGKILDILKAFRREWRISETLERLESEIIMPAIEEEREACRLIAQAEMERMRKRQIDRDGRGDMFRQGITQGSGQMAALIEVLIRNRSKQKGVEEK